MLEEVKKLWENLCQNVLLVDKVDYEIQEGKIGSKKSFKIILPFKGENLSVIIGKQGMTLFAINRLLSVWGFKKGVIVKVIQKRQ